MKNKNNSRNLVKKWIWFRALGINHEKYYKDEADEILLNDVAFVSEPP